MARERFRLANGWQKNSARAELSSLRYPLLSYRTSKQTTAHHTCHEDKQNTLHIPLSTAPIAPTSQTPQHTSTPSQSAVCHGTNSSHTQTTNAFTRLSRWPYLDLLLPVRWPFPWWAPYWWKRNARDMKGAR